MMMHLDTAQEPADESLARPANMHGSRFFVLVPLLAFVQKYHVPPSSHSFNRISRNTNDAFIGVSHSSSHRRSCITGPKGLTARARREKSAVLV
jgi:hypothetical protein